MPRGEGAVAGGCGCGCGRGCGCGCVRACVCVCVWLALVLVLPTRSASNRPPPHSGKARAAIIFEKPEVSMQGHGGKLPRCTRFTAPSHGTRNHAKNRTRNATDPSRRCRQRRPALPARQLPTPVSRPPAPALLPSAWVTVRGTRTTWCSKMPGVTTAWASNSPSTTTSTTLGTVAASLSIMVCLRSGRVASGCGRCARRRPQRLLPCPARPRAGRLHAQHADGGGP